MAFTLAVFSATAQKFKPFTFNTSIGYARIRGKLLSMEFKYAFTDKWELGLMEEFAGTTRSLPIEGQTKSPVLVSGLLTGKYYFSNTNFRPYVGLGVGLYHITGSAFSIPDGQFNGKKYTIEPENRFGVKVRAGFKAGHFNLGVEYNIVPSSQSDILGQTINSKNSYLGVKLGFDIGGGRK
jgi:outer membrane protein W